MDSFSIETVTQASTSQETNHITIITEPFRQNIIQTHLCDRDLVNVKTLWFTAGGVIFILLLTEINPKMLGND